jgi:DNA replication protein DnaC
VIDIANDPTYDQWTFSQKIRHALEQETAARTERRVLKLLKASRTPNPAACVEDIRYLDGRNLNRELVARLAACRWIDQTHNLVILGKSSVGKSYLAQALVNAACRRDYTAKLLPARRPREPARRLPPARRRTAVVPDRPAPAICSCSTTSSPPRSQGDRRRTAEHPRRPRRRGSTVVTSQFDPEDWYRSLHDAVIAESILNRIVSNAELVQLDGPNMRRHTHAETTS